MRTFDDDSRQHGRGEHGGPPGYDSVEWQLKIMKIGRYYKILDGDVIIGGIVIFPHQDGHYELGRIYLLPEYQNRGIGTLAMHFVEFTFPTATRWALDTPCWAIRNHHFYEKEGYLKVGESPHKTDDDFAFLYEKLMPG